MSTNTRAITINKQLFYKPLKTGGQQPSEYWKIQLFLPPTDIPEFINSSYEPKADLFFINFNYANKEPAIDLLDHEEISLKVGRESGKIVQLVIKGMKRRGIDKIALERIVKEEVSELIRTKSDESNNLREKNNLMRGTEALNLSASAISKSAEELLAVS